MQRGSTASYTIQCRLIAKCQHNTNIAKYQYNASLLPSVNAIQYKYCQVSIQHKLIARCQYNAIQTYCQVSIQILPSVNTIQILLSVNTMQYKYWQVSIQYKYWQVSIQYKYWQVSIQILPCVDTVALELFCGAQYIHRTFTPNIKHDKITTTTTVNIGVKCH